MAAPIICRLDRDAMSARGLTYRPGIEQEAECRLRRSGYLALRGVTCDISGGALRLHGRLPTYYLKQVAQTIAAEVEGVSR